MKGKSFDTFAPIGPYLVPSFDVSDPHNLGLWLDVNGERMQESNTSDMIFRVPELVSYVSRLDACTLISRAALVFVSPDKGGRRTSAGFRIHCELASPLASAGDALPKGDGS